MTHSKASGAALAIAVLISSGSVAYASPKVPEFIAQRGAKVIQIRDAEAGMTAMTIEKDGKQGVLFTSPDNSVAFFGVMFDAKTGANISDKYMPPKEKLVGAAALAEQQAQARNSVLSAQRVQEHVEVVEKSTETLRDHLLSDKVTGILEGKPSANTAFVFFDPLCGHCHKLYENTRSYVKAGASIKWIPINILGDQGLPMSVEAVKRGPQGLKDLVDGKLDNSPLRPLPAPQSVERAVIDHNTTFLYIMIQKMQAKNPGLKVATPTIFYAQQGQMAVGQFDGTEPNIKTAMDMAFGSKAK